MIIQTQLLDLLEELIQETDIFVVDVHCSNNTITVELDTDKGITICECALINKKLISALKEEAGDYNIKVSSPGLDKPFKVYRQYLKNIGHQLKVITTGSETMEGKLLKVEKEGVFMEIQKEKSSKLSSQMLAFEQIKKTKILLKKS